MKNQQKFWLRAATATSLVAVLAACPGSNPGDSDGAPEGRGFREVALFQPLIGRIPFPTNVFFGADGTLNIPSSSPPAVAANNLDGWSTVAPTSIEFNADIDPTSVTPGLTVRMFHFCSDPRSGAPIGPGPDLELRGGIHFTASVATADSKELLIKPLVPLRPAYDLAPTARPAPGVSDCAAQVAASNPAKPRNTYFIAVTNGIRTTGGNAFETSIVYEAFKRGGAENALVTNTGALTDVARDLGLANPADGASYERLRQLVSGLEGGAAQIAGLIKQQVPQALLLDTSSIISSTVFSTQSVGHTNRVLAASSTARAHVVQNTGLNTSNVIPGAPGAAGIHAGFIQLPYFLGIPDSQNPNAINTDFFCADSLATCAPTTFLDPVPVSRDNVNVPLLITIPRFADTNGTPIPNGTKLPVVIFQHGITSDRSAALAIADSFAAAGMATVAIDLPLHGVTPTNPANALRNANITERTFDVDLLNDTTGAPGPDGTVDGSGAHFINLVNLLVARDNVRQAVSDLHNLANTVPSISLTTDQGNTVTLDGGTRFAGHSLGAIVGTPFLATADTNLISSAALINGGGSIPKILDGSAAFSGRIRAGLAAVGAVAGTPAYEDFLRLAQTVVDTTDPINNTASAVATATGNRPILFQEIVGSSSSPSDLVVPNQVPNVPANPGESVFESAPLAGSSPLIQQLGLQANDGCSAGGGVVRVTSGTHSSILDPRADRALTVRLQSEVASFLRSNGAAMTSAACQQQQP